MITVGEKRFYKLSKSRGRPFVGEVLKNQGIFVLMKDSKGEEVRVQSKFIGKPYEFKPYNTKNSSFQDGGSAF